MSNKPKYYYIDQKLELKQGNAKLLLILFCIILIGLIGVYYFALTLSPTVLADNSQVLKNKQKVLVSQNVDFILIEKLNLILPFSKDSSQLANSSGVWWQKPELGNPENGGNFILSAYRFKLGLTPAITKEKSAFFNLDKLNQGDEIEVFYKNTNYKYKVESKQTPPVDIAKFTAESPTAKLTILTKKQSGQIDDNIAVVATPIVKLDNNNSNSKSLKQNILF